MLDSRSSRLKHRLHGIEERWLDSGRHSGFNYDSASKTATWTLADPIGADRILIDLSGPISAQRRFDILPADVTQDGAVGRTDIVGLLRAFSFTTGDAQFDFHKDINGSGAVDLLDLAGLRRHFGQMLPAGVPASAPAALLVSAANSPADRLAIRQRASHALRSGRIARPRADRVVDAVFADASQISSSDTQTTILRSRRTRRPTAGSLRAEIVDELFR